MSDKSPKDFRDELLTGLWKDLAPHLEREAIFVVSQDLDLGDVGRAVVSDDATLVNDWIKHEQIARPTVSQIKSWNQDQDKSFRFLIAAPYVLIQELAH